MPIRVKWPVGASLEVVESHICKCCGESTFPILRLRSAGGGDNTLPLSIEDFHSKLWPGVVHAIVLQRQSEAKTNFFEDDHIDLLLGERYSQATRKNNIDQCSQKHRSTNECISERNSDSNSDSDSDDDIVPATAAASSSSSALPSSSVMMSKPSERSTGISQTIWEKFKNRSSSLECLSVFDTATTWFASERVILSAIRFIVHQVKGLISTIHKHKKHTRGQALLRKLPLTFLTIFLTYVAASVFYLYMRSILRLSARRLFTAIRSTQHAKRTVFLASLYMSFVYIGYAVFVVYIWLLLA